MELTDIPPMNWAPVPATLLDVPGTLCSGQAFRWSLRADGRWAGVIADAVVLLEPREEGFLWQTYPEPGRWDLLVRYFALEVDLPALERMWREAEPAVAGAMAKARGLRILRQAPEEVFFAFVCASCNTVTKITRSVNALCRHYGVPLARVNGELYYSFPDAARIADSDEALLRKELWGYRAPRLIALARHVVEQGPGWFERLRAQGYAAAHAELSGLFGIGAKLADCICLFGLGFDDAVPVDTHVRQIAVRLFRPDLAGRSLTPRVYGEVVRAFHARFSPYSGWAQQYLFVGELASSPGRGGQHPGR